MEGKQMSLVICDNWLRAHNFLFSSLKLQSVIIPYLACQYWKRHHLFSFFSSFNCINFFSLWSLILQTNLPVFKVKESSVRRRYSDFEWLRNELERDSKVSNSTTIPFRWTCYSHNFYDIYKIFPTNLWILLTSCAWYIISHFYRLWCQHCRVKHGNGKCHSAVMMVYSMRILSKRDAKALKVLSIK